MEQRYEITASAEGLLSLGSRVEIFEAGRGAEDMPARVRSMRVEGNVLIFGAGDGRHPGTKTFHSNEGEVVFIERANGRTRFSLRLRS